MSAFISSTSTNSPQLSEQPAYGTLNSIFEDERSILNFNICRDSLSRKLNFYTAILITTIVCLKDKIVLEQFALVFAEVCEL